MIQFKCPHCEKAFRVDDSYASKHAKCSCGQRITVPGASPPPLPSVKTQLQEDEADAFALSMLSPPTPATAPADPPNAATSKQKTKACPFCEEEILVAAKKCKHCGEILSNAIRAAQGAQGASKSSREGAKAIGCLVGLGLVVLILFFADFVIKQVRRVGLTQKQVISYEVLEKWDSEPLTDEIFGMKILVAEGSSHQDVQNLVENLTQDSAGKNVRIYVFDSRDAWQVYEREQPLAEKGLPSKISDDEYVRRVNHHYLLNFLHTAHNTQVVRWVAEEQKADDERERAKKEPAKERARVEQERKAAIEAAK